VLSPLSPVLEQTRALYQLGEKLGLVRSQSTTLRAPVPDTRF
jgi:hypothetical protein